MAGTVRPLGDRVLVKVIVRDRKTMGGVILPDNVREESDRGLVLDVGPGSQVEGAIDSGAGETYRALPVSKGEVVLFSPYAGVKVAVGNDDFLLLREHDVLGVLDGVEIEEDEHGVVRIKNDEYVVTA